MGALGRRLRGRDVEIGMVLTFFLGLGVLFLNLYSQNPTRAVGVLFGSILSISRQDVLISMGIGIVVLLILAGIFRPLLFTSIDPEIAEARGIPVRGLSIIFTLLLAITVSVTVQIVGVLLVFAMLVVPAATAEFLTHRPLSMLGLSVIISVIVTWMGLVLAFVTNTPASFCIVSLMSLVYFTARIFRHSRFPRRYQPQPHPTREISQD